MTLDEALKEIETLKADKETLTTKNGELTTNLTNQRKTHETELKEVQEKLETAETTIKTGEEAKTAELTTYQEKRIKDMSKGDATVEQKIRDELENNVKFDGATREGIDAGAMRAFQLATGKVADPLATHTDALATDDEGQSVDTKLTPAAEGVYDRMFGAGAAAKATEGTK